MTRSLVRMILLASLVSLSCTEEIVVSNQDALVDPRIAPRVTFSSPPLNSVGPYAGWGGGLGADYDILLRFNKLMDPVSLREGLRLRSSVRNLEIYRTYLNPRDLSEKFSVTPLDSGRLWFTPPQIGEVLTLDATKPLTDVNGNVIPAGLLGTMLPEPFFRVREIFPHDGETLGPQGQVLLVFNSTVDSSIFSSISVDPPFDARWWLSFDGYDTRVVVSAAAVFPAGGFTVVVAKGARDHAGHVLPADFSAHLRSAGLEVLGSPFPDGTTDIPLWQSLQFSFSLPIDSSTVAGAVRIAPVPAGGMRLGIAPSSLSLTPVVNFAPETHYTVTIDTTLRSTDGRRLSAPRSYTFTTIPFVVESTYPADHDTGVSLTRDIQVIFTANLDTSTIRGAFSISPPTDGIVYSPRVEWTRLYFGLADAFQPYTTYTVTIDTTLAARGGYRLKHPLLLTFRTGGQ